MNKELTEKLKHLELSHKDCMNFMGKAYYEGSKDRLESALYFHDTFNKQLKEIRELIEKDSQLIQSKVIKIAKYSL